MRGEYLHSINDLSEIEAKYITLMYDADHTDMLASRQADLSRLQYTIRDMLATTTTPTPETIRLAVHIQSEDMTHLANRIQQMKYDVQEIIDVYPQRLAQYSVDPAKLEIPYLEVPKVVHFVFHPNTDHPGNSNKHNSGHGSSNVDEEPESEPELEPELEPEDIIGSDEPTAFDADYLSIANNEDDIDIVDTPTKNNPSDNNADNNSIL